MRALVTGGAGFIGSSLCEALANDGWALTVLDNMSTGSKKNLDQIVHSARGTDLKIIVGDCTRLSIARDALRSCDTIFHFAANPEVRMDRANPVDCFQQNVYATYVMLEAFRHSRADTVVFASSSTVYGEANILPTPEDYSPLEPISIYAGSKLGCEALVAAYCHAFGKHGVILRFANIVGPRSGHGVVPDFIARLQKNPRELEILGDGTQTKSYVYIDDCVDAILRSVEEPMGPVEIFNVGSQDQVDVRTIGGLVAREVGLKDVELKFDGGMPDGRGWLGDIKKMLLDVRKLQSKGWTPKYNSTEAVRMTVRSILNGRTLRNQPT
jgi:UDP-glucose 4-epimerase